MEDKAFPYEEWINSDDPKVVNPIRHHGMDLRDWFAGFAMQALLRRQDDTFMEIDFKVTSDEAVKQLNKLLSKDAYELADAMMEVRNGNKE